MRGHRPTGSSAIVVGLGGAAGSALSVLVCGGLLPPLIGVARVLERVGVEPLPMVMALSAGALLLGEDVLTVALRGLRRSPFSERRRPA